MTFPLVWSASLWRMRVFAADGRDLTPADKAELALADQTLARLLDAFAHNQGDDVAIPHSYANKRVLAALRIRLGLAPEAALDAAAPAAIRAAAVAELRADSARRQPAAHRPPG